MSTHPFTTVIRDGDIWTGGESPQLFNHHDLIIEDGVVAAIEPKYLGRADVEVDAERSLVIPGLINCHTHCGSTPVSRGVSEDLDLAEDGAFYHSLIPLLSMANEELTEEEFSYVMAWDAMAILMGGATTIVEESFHAPAAWIKIVERFGFRCSFGLTYPGNVGAIGYIKDGKVFKDPAPNLERVFRENVRLCEEENNQFDGRLQMHLSPHASDTVPAELLRETQQIARDRGWTVHLHLAQHLTENKAIEEMVGMSPVKYLDSLGFLGDNVLATHVTYTDAEDWDLLASTRTNIVHCAYRKAKEGLISPFWEFLSRGANVALATDSFHHSLVDDLKLAALLGKIDQKSVGRPTARQVLGCATAGAAKALHRPDLGHLNPGATGDAVVFKFTSPYNSPVFDPIRSLVYYSGSHDIRHSVVNGRPVITDGAVVAADADDLYNKVDAIARRLWERASQESSIIPNGTHWYLLEQ
jgi:cytosine/adenosine deaminase-related metal-dependent hydrolase